MAKNFIFRILLVITVLGYGLSYAEGQIKIMKSIRRLDGKTGDFIFNGAFRQGHPVTSKSSQYVGIPKELDMFLKKHQGHPESFFEPYWKGGEWVFYREISTQKPLKGQSTMTLAHGGCRQLCPSVYVSYGKVCGQRLETKTGKYAFKNFDNICQLELENCKNPKKPWVPVRQDECWELEEFKGQGSREFILNNAKTHLSRVDTNTK